MNAYHLLIMPVGNFGSHEAMRHALLLFISDSLKQSNKYIDFNLNYMQNSKISTHHKNYRQTRIGLYSTHGLRECINKYFRNWIC